jgi:hypothetical protein
VERSIAVSVDCINVRAAAFQRPYRRFKAFGSRIMESPASPLRDNPPPLLQDLRMTVRAPRRSAVTWASPSAASVNDSNASFDASDHQLCTLCRTLPLVVRGSNSESPPHLMLVRSPSAP